MTEVITVRPHHVLRLVAYALNPNLFMEEIKHYNSINRNPESPVAMYNVTQKISDQSLIELVPSIDDICRICKVRKKYPNCGLENDPWQWVPLRYRFAHFGERHPFLKYKEASTNIISYLQSFEEFEDLEELEDAIAHAWDDEVARKAFGHIILPDAQVLYPGLQFPD